MEILCRDAIPLKALGIQDLRFPWNSGVVRCATITCTETERLPQSWIGCVHAVIGFQRISSCCNYAAEHLAVKFAADTLGINATSVASAAIYLSPGGIPFSLKDGNLSLTS